MRTDDPKENYEFSTNAFTDIVNKNKPLKMTFIGVNQDPLSSLNLGKEIYTRNRFKNKFCKNPSKENEKLEKTEKPIFFPLEKMYERILSQMN